MDKCPYCGAETREGDNFCLNCGNRLVSTPVSGQAQEVGDNTQASPEEWNAVQDHGAATAGSGTADAWPAGQSANEATIAEPVAAELPTQRPAQALTMDRIEQPARFVLRADDGSVVQEYPLDKMEITIGRAPNSDVLLSKDKLTSRRHATVRYENGNYVLRDERSANGTFVNGQQIEELVPRVLQEGDHIGIGEHELLFRTFNAPSSMDVEDMPTISVNPSAEMTYGTREDSMATAATSNDFSTHSMENGTSADAQPVQQQQEVQPVENVPQTQAEENQPEQAATPSLNGSVMPTPAAMPGVPVASAYSTPETTNGEKEQAPIASTQPPFVDMPGVSGAAQTSNAPASSSSYTAQTPPTTTGGDSNVTFSRLTSIAQPPLPDMTALMAAMSTLDGQVMALQEQIHSTQDAMHNHDAEVAQTTNQLRGGVRRVMERMDNTIADVARSREALAWADLSQLMEDVMNNPRDIEYVTKLARKARELNKIFQIHQNVLNTMYECNSLLRGLIGEER